MKKLLPGLLITAFLASSASISKGQQSSANLLTGIAICTPGTPGNIISGETVHPRAKRFFEKEYKSAKNVQWLQLKDGQLAGFTENDIRYSVYFNHNGSKAGSIKGYAPCQLENATQQLMEAGYPGYKITYVNEVKAAANGNVPVFVINITGAKEDIKVIKVCEGETEVAYDSSQPGKPAKRF